MEDTRKEPGPSLPADAFLHFLLWERQVALAAFTRTSSSKGVAVLVACALRGWDGSSRSSALPLAQH